MALFSSSVAKERLNIPAADTADDTVLSNLGAGCDSEIVNQVYEACKKIRNLKALPEIDVTNGLVGGSTAPQSLKDASTNLVVARYHAIHSNKEMADYWEKLSRQSAADFVKKLAVDGGIFVGVIID